MYIICYTLKMKKKNLLPDEYEFHSDYSAVETLQKARFIYKSILERDNVYSVTICKPIESTEPQYIEGE